MADGDNGNGIDYGEDGAENVEPPEMFPAGSLEGEGKTFKTLIRAGLPVELTVSLSRAEVPLRNGIPDPDKPIRVLTTALFQSAVPVVKERGDDGKVKAWKARVNLRTEYVEHVDSTDAGLITQRFRAMLEASPSEAGALLEQLQALAAESLTAA